MSNAGDGDKRTVTTDALETLGTIIGPNEKRDAIHLAVEPVEAGENLRPGEYITVTNGIAEECARSVALGIVDPFLEEGPSKGERFWFIMMPRQVRSLRHVWTHPAFPDEPGTSSITGNKAESEAWLRSFCEVSDCPRYERLIPLILGQREQDENDDGYGAYASFRDDYLFFGNTDAHGDIPPQFWDHIEVVTGQKMNRRPAHFSCSC